MGRKPACLCGECKACQARARQQKLRLSRSADDLRVSGNNPDLQALFRRHLKHGKHMDSWFASDGGCVHSRDLTFAEWFGWFHFCIGDDCLNAYEEELDKVELSAKIQALTDASDEKKRLRAESGRSFGIRRPD